MAAEPLSQLEGVLGHRFASPQLLEEAVTHVSATNGTRSYQRLEFLGDRILGLIVSDMLYHAFPDATEGEMSKRLAELVRKETCADVARGWDLGAHLRLGEGERRNGGRKRIAILGDACEAVIGAVYCDAGLEAVRALIHRGWEIRMNASPTVPKDAKTLLQETVQAQGLKVPDYVDIGRSGPDHAPVFEVAVRVERYPDAIGRGGSKRVAERAAAEAWLRREGHMT